MAGIDLTGKDPFSAYMPRVNSVLDSAAGGSSGLLSGLASSVLPNFSNVFNKTDSSSSAAISGMGNVSFDNPLSPGNNPDQTLKTVVGIIAVGALLIALVKVLR